MQRLPDTYLEAWLGHAAIRRAMPGMAGMGGQTAESPRDDGDLRPHGTDTYSAADAEPKPLATIPSGLPIAEITKRLQELQEKFPNAEVRRGRANRWELWPRESG